MRFNFSLMLLFTLFATSITAFASSSPIASFVFDKADGLDIVTVPGDGMFEQRFIDGKQVVCLKSDDPKNIYLYFQFEPALRKKIGSDVYLVVEFLDKNTGAVRAQFNSKNGPYTECPGFLLLNTKTWQKALIHLTDASFKGLQNNKSDFRFYSGNPLIISRIDVYAKKPDLDIPTMSERVQMSNLKSGKPQGMFYTYGNEADESTAPLYRALGVTSIESYVTWESCEREAEGKWDWSQWDKQVKILQENDLKWVPFLILGPAYSTPNWFRASKEHVPCCCLEHGIDSKIESLWNPYLPKRIERFIKEFADRYEKTGVVESVLLGIQGDYGEAIYSVWGGGWTFNIPGEYHNHHGFWCNDPYALASYRKFIEKRYMSVDAVNKAWGSAYGSLEKVDFPAKRDELKTFQEKVASGDPQVRRQWLDFIDWYRESMTEWADWWMATTRKYFPKTPIYLCTGGDAMPPQGSNFADQCRVAAKHGAGVRITNEGSDYDHNYVVTRWVASAGKHYGAYYGFEPAGPEDEKGVVARIYNATASGANQLHDYSNNMTKQSCIEALREHIKYLFNVPKPVVPVALWYPNVSLTLKWGGYLEKAGMLRDYIDYDYLDESMLHMNALAEHKILLILQGNVMESADARQIAAWIENGGRVIVMGVPKFESVEGTSDPETILFADTPKGRAIGKGSIIRVVDKDALVQQLKKDLGELGLAVYDLQADGIFGTQISDNKFLFLNTGSADAQVNIQYKGKDINKYAGAGTITEIDLE